MKAIILDMDGLMIDTERLYYNADEKVAKEYRKNINHTVIEQMIGQKPLDAMKIFQEYLCVDVSPQNLLKKRDKYFLEMLETDLRPMPGLMDFLTIFQSKFKLAIATGSINQYVQIILSKLNLYTFFDVIQTSDSIQKGKPDPEIYIQVIKKLKISSDECIVLEDSSNGVKSAKRAGCYVIAIPSNYTMNQDFSQADYKASDLQEASDHILELITK